MLSLIIVALTACDPGQKAPVREPLSLTRYQESYNCPEDADWEGYLIVPPPPGEVVTLSVLACGPAYVFSYTGACMSEGYLTLSLSKSGTMDAVMVPCGSAETVLFDYLLEE